MDKTLKPGTGKNKRRRERNGLAWRLFSPDGETCRYCPHDGSKHLISSGQPHFYRPATEEEKRDPTVTLYQHDTPRDGTILLRRITVSKQAEVITAFCTACANWPRFMVIPTMNAPIHRWKLPGSTSSRKLRNEAFLHCAGERVWRCQRSL